MNHGLSIHVVDITRASAARGMKVEVWRIEPARPLLGEGTVEASGLVRHPAFGERLVPGLYEAVFFVADYYRAVGTPVPDPPFLDDVVYRFGIADPDQHYHLPFKVTPWGFSLFRGR